ncbi:P-loop ATPase, Sll1717 family [Bradyrhizobium ottawaense]|uniref:P-loop ATPase, Sll1717 family n=1 Tax=Bradyrhizobium ottawaense TaxID=931866 RepID=UPI00383987D2
MANPIVFKQNSDIGAADAESDELFLDNCFKETGDLAVLLDCTDPKCLVLGRTGSGKTAILRRVLKQCEHAVELSPETLSLSYVLNSNIIRFFEEAGVRLEPFYALLWRHIITVELLKLRYGITNAAKQSEFLERIKHLIAKNKAREKALNYLNEWGDKFWEETAYRTKEFTRKLETDLSASAKVHLAEYLQLGADGARKLSEEQKIEVRQSGNRVVSEVQVKDLHEVINLLSEDIFNDAQKHYYVVVDRLDEDWIDDTLRFKLIKSLIETVRSFRKVQNIKIIVALRTDLHYRVLKETDQAGFQEEKYRSLYLPIRWTREQLADLLDARVGYMFKRRYTTEGVRLQDILPTNQIQQRTALDYILDRTFFRPREAIIYLNECIKRALGAARITVSVLTQAEVAYSQQRMKSLGDEWKREYPNLEAAARFFSHRKTQFRIEEITTDEAKAFALSILELPTQAKDPIYLACERYYLDDEKISTLDFMREIVAIFYHVGLCGVKPDAHLGRQWSYLDEPELHSGQIKPTAQVDLHKTFWAALGVVPSKGRFTTERES